MISKVHVTDMKAIRFNLYVSEFLSEHNDTTGFQKITFKEKIVSGKERIIDVGNIPARFLIIEVEKGVPLPKKNNLQVFGIKHDQINDILGEGYNQMLFDNAY